MKRSGHMSLRAILIIWILIVYSTVSMYAQRDWIVKEGIWKNQQIKYLQGEIVIIRKPGVTDSVIIPILSNHHLNVLEGFDKLGIGRFSFPDSIDIFPLMEALEQNPLIKAAEPNMVGRPYATPNDTYFSTKQWSLQNSIDGPIGGKADIHITQAWDLWKGTADDTMAILDFGISLDDLGRLNHEDLYDASRFILGPDETDEIDTTVRDGNGHGTHVIGIAAAMTDNNTGIAGVAWNCKVLVIQVMRAPHGPTP